MLIAAFVGLGLGLSLIESLTTELRASLDVSSSTIATIGDTVAIAAELSEGTTDSVRSAGVAAASASTATRAAGDAIKDAAEFLAVRLPADIEAISRALPGAVGAADAIDTALNALSFVGVNYRPDEPFGQSLRRISQALQELPQEVAAQGDNLEGALPSTNALSEDVATLAGDLMALSSTLEEVEALAETYRATVVEAEIALGETSASLDRTSLLLRLLVILASLGAAAIGYALIRIDRALTSIAPPA